MIKVLDISKWNRMYKKDYDRVANEVDGVIMRAGYTGWGKPAKNKVIDELFNQHDRELRKRGVPLGIYWYGTDESPAEARVAAAKCLEFANGRSYPLGVFYDTEDNHYQRAMGKELLTSTVLAFIGHIEKNTNYRVGVYASTYWFKDQLDFKRLKNRVKNLIIWEANYGVNDGTLNSTPKFKPHLHQYTSRHKINGQSFDLNQVLDHYWKDKKSDLELAEEVLIGKHGNGKERKKSLGNRYKNVQKIVNRIVYGGSVHEDSIRELAKRAYRGEFGNGETRKRILGDEYDEVQRMVNKLYYK